MASRVRVYMACSLDGFIAGPGDDLSFLHEPEPEGSEPAAPAPTEALEYEAFMSQVGVMLMGRRTHDVVAAMGQWPYGETPVLVATHRPLEPMADTISTVTGDITSLIAQAKEVAGEKDVYLDGGLLIRQAIDAGLVDELCLTYVPILLGDGVRLFDGLEQQTKLEFVAHHRYGPRMLQITMRPRRG